MTYIPKAHELYKHFKGNLYQIVAIAEHTETREELVVYQAMYGDFKIYARPYSMFGSKVDKEKYPDVDQEYRFELQGAAGDPRMAVQGDGQAQNVLGHDKAANSRDSREASSQEETSREGQEEYPEELKLDPMVLKFLDADTYEERLNILTGIRHRVTDEMITTMSIACDIEIGDGNTQKRFEALKNCLVTLEKYECNRLR